MGIEEYLQEYLDNNYAFLNLKKCEVENVRFTYYTVNGERDTDFAITLEREWDGIMYEVRILEGSSILESSNDWVVLNTVQSIDPQILNVGNMLDRSIYVKTMRRESKINEILE